LPVKAKRRSIPRPPPTQPPVRVRRSTVDGKGVFATKAIRKGARIIEYLGERISHDESDRRFATKADDDNHTFLFTVDDAIVIDAGTKGNAARYINHSCDPNCESVVEDSRVFIDAIRSIREGEELAYDYNILRAPEDPPDVDVIFACRCGSALCRGSMLEEKKTPKKKSARKPGKKKART